MKRSAFTLIELLVVIAIIALLIGILIPSLGRARDAARAIVCLSNVRSLEIAHTLYADANEGAFVDAGLSHGGVGNLDDAWPLTLAGFNGGPLILHSPVDNSVFWSDEEGGSDPGRSLAAAIDLFEHGHTSEIGPIARWTSYGLSSYTCRSVAPSLKETFDRDSLVPTPSATVHFLMMTQGDVPGSQSFAKADHVHPNDWGDVPPEYAPAVAQQQLDMAAHGGEPGRADARANYGFLDGHAETRAFGDVYTSSDANNFDPRRAH